MPTMPRSHTAGHFALEIDGKDVGRFETLLTAPAPGMPPQPLQPQQIFQLTTRPAATPALGAPRHVHGMVSRFSAGGHELWMKRGICNAMELQRWKSAPAARNVVLAALNTAGHELKRYKLTNCWPKNWHGSPAAAGGGDIAIEDIVIMYEGIQPA